MELDRLIAETIEAKANDGTINKIVNDQLDKMIADIVRDCCSYGSSSYKYVRSKLDEVMSNAFKQTNFEAYVDAFKIVIDKIVGDSSVKEYASICKELKNLLGEHSEAPKEIKLSEMFSKFCEYVGDQTIEYDDDFESMDDGSAQVNATLTVEKARYGSSKKVTFKIERCCKNDCCSLFDESYSFSSYDSDGYGYIRFDGNDLFEMRNASSFMRWLMKLSAGYTHVIFDVCNLEEEVTLYVE